MVRVLACLLIVSCGSQPQAEQPTPPPDQVRGLIVDVQKVDDRMVSFEVEAAGDTYEILIDPERDYGFNLNHLEVHFEQELPVLVDLEARDGALYAVSILDA